MPYMEVMGQPFCFEFSVVQRLLLISGKRICDRNNMLNRCVAQFCGKMTKKGVGTHSFPRITIREKWVKFVNVKQANFDAPTLNRVLCSKHIRSEDYELGMMQGFGFKSKFSSRPGKDAVPTGSRSTVQQK